MYVTEGYIPVILGKMQVVNKLVILFCKICNNEWLDIFERMRLKKLGDPFS